MHGGALHILFNSLAMFQLGSTRERQIGTVSMLISSFIMCVLGGLLQVLIGMLFELVKTGIRNDDALLHQWFAPDLTSGCAVGLSGLLFSLLVIRFSQPEHRNQSMRFFEEEKKKIIIISFFYSFCHCTAVFFVVSLYQDLFILGLYCLHWLLFQE